GVADQDLAWKRRLLEPGGDVDGIPGGERAAVVRHDLAGVDSHADLELGPELFAELAAQAGEARAELVRRARRPQRVVLVDDRDPEHRHHGVADEFLDRPAVTLEHLARGREIAFHYPAERLRVETFAERCRPGHVAE